MRSPSSKTIHRWIVVVMLVVLASSVGGWWATRDTLPARIRIAGGDSGGMYHELAGALAPLIEARTGKSVDVVVTAGSVENRQRLLTDGPDGVEIAMLQSGSVDLHGLAVVAPVYLELVHIVVRKELLKQRADEGGVQAVPDLVGKRVSLGAAGSGMVASATQVLEHYDIDPANLQDTKAHFPRLSAGREFDAAIVTTGTENPDLVRLMDSGEFGLLPILDAEAIAMRHPHYHIFTLPRSFYDERPAVPPTDIPTLATAAVLAVRRDASPALVRATLGAVYEDGLGRYVPTLIPRSEALRYTATQLHNDARGFLDPFDSLGWFKDTSESLVAAKELLLAVGAALFLIWDRWRYLQERERKKIMQAQKDHLDEFLTQTLRIEERIMETHDHERLHELLNDVTRIKTKALAELTDEELRGDQSFAIFLMQCSNVIQHIRLKMISSTPKSPPTNE